jgi:hypothetical protein
MTAADFPRIRVGVVAAATLAYWALLGWEYTHGGVTGHSFLARDDMPVISNWWGGLTIPIVAFVLTGRVQRRLAAFGADTAGADRALRIAVAACIGAALYGAAMALGFSLGYDELSSWLFQALPLVGLLLPIYRAEYLLGFIVALSLRFGGVLPLIISTAVAVVSLVLHATVRRGLTWLLSRRSLLQAGPPHGNDT